MTATLNPFSKRPLMGSFYPNGSHWIVECDKCPAEPTGLIGDFETGQDAHLAAEKAWNDGMRNIRITCTKK